MTIEHVVAESGKTRTLWRACPFCNVPMDRYDSFRRHREECSALPPVDSEPRP